MNPEIITTLVIVAFLLVLLAGFLFGLGRGFNKSLVRLLIVTAMLVITFFIVPSITKALMTADISGLGISINGKTATSVGGIIVAALNKVPYIQDIAGTAAYATIINVVPQMILNVVLFVVVFILLRLISMIIYWIIAGTCFNKKKMQGKNKHRLLGSLIGVVQNFLIFLVILVPVVGTVNILGDIETIVTTPATEAVSPASVYFADGETPEETPAQNSPYQTINNVIDAYEDSWVAKFMHAVKLDNACMYVFDELSTVTENEQEYNLRDEATNITYIALDVMELTKLEEFSLANENTIAAINKVIDSCYKSKLTAGLVDELIDKATEKWIAGEQFLGLNKPTIEGFDDVINDLLQELHDSTDVKATLQTTASMLQSVMNSVGNIIDGESINIDSVGELLDSLTEDPAKLELAQKVIQENIGSILDSIMPTPEDPENPGNPDTDAPEETYKSIITETVSSILDAAGQDGVSISDEMNVISETFNVAEKLMAEEPSIEQTDVDNVIKALDQSTVILGNLENADNSSVKDFLQNVGAMEGMSTYIETAINNPEFNIENKDLLMQIFGIQSQEDPAE